MRNGWPLCECQHVSTPIPPSSLIGQRVAFQRDCRRFLLLKRLRFTVTLYLAVVNALCQVQLNSTHSRLGGELVRGEIWVVDTPMATHAQFFFASLSPITPILGTGS